MYRTLNVPALIFRFRYWFITLQCDNIACSIALIIHLSVCTKSSILVHFYYTLSFLCGQEVVSFSWEDSFSKSWTLFSASAQALISTQSWVLSSTVEFLADSFSEVHCSLATRVSSKRTHTSCNRAAAFALTSSRDCPLHWSLSGTSGWLSAITIGAVVGTVSWHCVCCWREDAPV